MAITAAASRVRVLRYLVGNCSVGHAKSRLIVILLNTRNDTGRYEVTKHEADKYVFKVPILRNVERTAPYFHDGSVSHLEDAVWMMGKIQLGRNLTKEQKERILSFLASLTGTISENALKIPILPPSE